MQLQVAHVAGGVSKLHEFGIMPNDVKGLAIGESSNRRFQMRCDVA